MKHTESVGSWRKGARVRRSFLVVFCVLALSTPPGAHWDPQQHLVSGDAAEGDAFGSGVAVSGDTLVVTAYSDDTADGNAAGSGYVYKRNAGVWSQEARLYAVDAQPDDWFGTAAAISGDRIVVGAWSDATPAGASAGSVYPFARSGKSWGDDGHLFAGDPEAGDWFGFSVAISADTIVAGVPKDDTPAGATAGSAYVFKRGTTFWFEQGHLFPGDPGAGDNFGKSVAVDGDTVVVGAQLWDVVSGDNSGCAYVFTRTAGIWSQHDQLIGDDLESGDEAGASVAVSGDLAVIGTPQDNTFAGSDTGAAYVFVRSGGTWTQEAYLFADDAQPNDHFGAAVAISGDTILVGAPGDDTFAGADAGSAYLFTRVAGVWSQQDHIFASDPAANDRFAATVALSADTALIGVEDDEVGVLDFAGSAYVFVENFFDVWVGEPPILIPGRR